MQKTLEKQKGSIVKKGSLNKRTAKKAASKLNIFCIRYFPKWKRKPAKKNTEKCFPINNVAHMPKIIRQI